MKGLLAPDSGFSSIELALNTYILKLNRHIRSIRLKSLGIYLLHLPGKRYFGIFHRSGVRLQSALPDVLFQRRREAQGSSARDVLEGRPCAPGGRFLPQGAETADRMRGEPSLFPYNMELIRLGAAPDMMK
jgi:hypothetical protein